MAAGEGASSRSARRRWWGTELGARVASAVVLGIAALVTTYTGGWLFALFWLLAGIATVVEWIGMTRVEPRRPVQVALGAGLALWTLLYLAGAGPWAFVGVAAASVLGGVALAHGSRDRLWAAAGFVYAGVIALVPPLVRDRPDLGLVGLLWMFAVVWTTDVAAYFTGRRLGGPKLWPRVSPKKTWSGFGGGLLAGTAAGLIVALAAETWGQPMPIPLAGVALASAVASVASQGGDLAESALKRSFDVKDSSHLIPGHGGVMDRLDGFWAVAALLAVALLAERLG
jgi:phosphatidate cytidylyltransferase